MTPTNTLDLPSTLRKFILKHVGAQNHVDKENFPVTGFCFHFIDSICIYCMVSCEQCCLMSTELSVIVCVVMCSGVRDARGKAGVS